MDKYPNKEIINKDYLKINFNKDKYDFRTPSAPNIVIPTPTPPTFPERRVFNESRFIRNPNLAYLEQALMLEDEDTLRRIAVIGYNFTLGDKAYPQSDFIKKYEQATVVVDGKLESALQDNGSFEGLLIEIASTTAYENFSGIKKEGKLRDRSKSRDESVPVIVYSAISSLAEKLGSKALPAVQKEQIYQHEPHGGMMVDAINVPNNDSLKPMVEVVEGVRRNFFKAFADYKSGNKDAALENASKGLHEMFNAWFWAGANSSRSMLIFNVVLEKIGIQPMSHGIIDFAAYLLDEETFVSYIKYLNTIKR